MKTHHMFMNSNVSEALPSILGHVLMDGQEVGSRQGERTMELLMPRIILNQPWQREVLVPGRKASIAAQIAETMWVLAGRDDVEWLSHYLPRAADFSDDGETWRGAYGPRLRKWLSSNGDRVDQLAHVVDLLNNERGTRRAVMNIYDPDTDSSPGKDVPCNNWLSFISREGKLHLNVATRSNDVIWGWSGINQFEWSVLQEIVAYLTGNQVGTLTFNVTSLHVYEKHWDKAARISQGSEYNSPVLQDSPRFAPIGTRDVEYLDVLIKEWFEIEGKIRGGSPMQYDVDRFPEPMLKSWLRVIQWYWAPAGPWLKPLIGSRLHMAAQMSPPNPVLRQPDPPQPGDIKISGKFPVADDGTITIGSEFLTDVPMPNTLEGMSLVIGASGSGTNGHQVGDQVDIYTLPATPSQIAAGPLFHNSTQDKVLPLLWTAQFIEYVDNLHREKGKAYGNSWNKRGEQMSIMANIARKVDRLGVAGGGDSSADTVIDLLVYLLKYRVWLSDEKGAPTPNSMLYYPPDLSEVDKVRSLLDLLDRDVVKRVGVSLPGLRIVAIKSAFEELEKVVLDDPHTKFPSRRILPVITMAKVAFPLARGLWGQENGHVVTNTTRFWAGYENEGENID